MKEKDIDIEGVVKSAGYYIVNRRGRFNCQRGHFDIDGENLEDIIGDFYGIDLDDGVRLRITIERIED